MKEFVARLLDDGVLASPDLLDLHSSDTPALSSLRQLRGMVTVLNRDVVTLISQGFRDVDWLEFDKMRVVMERDGRKQPYQQFLHAVAPTFQRSSTSSSSDPVRVVRSFLPEEKKISIKNFVSTFRSRYEFLRKILQARSELQSVSSLHRLGRNGVTGDISAIGLVYNKLVTKQGNILLSLEDATGFVKVLVNKNSRELYQLAETVCLDEVIGVVGTLRDSFIFAKNILFPEVFNTAEKRCPDDVYAAFISDIHVGSTMFLEAEFRKFLRWLNGEEGDDAQRQLGLKVKYLFVIGDSVDGVGVFPGQERHLTISDIREQYRVLATLFRELRQDITIILCPGQHDAVRVAEPQPMLDKDFAGALWELPNIIFVSNPSLVTINATQDFEGYHILLYHGASFHYYIDGVSQLREQKARDNPSFILKFLLQKRHLAPSYGSTVYVPTNHEDALVISKVPDLFVCGDMHRSDISQYNGVVTVNCSCWQAKTDFQEKTGNNPDPCKVPLFHLQTRQISIMGFAQNDAS